MATEGPRHGSVTPTDHGITLKIVALFLIIFTILSIFIRLQTRFFRIRRLEKGDAFAFGAMLCAVASSAAICVAVTYRLGSRRKDLDMKQIRTAEKLVYVSTLFYLATLGLAKISWLVFIGRLTLVKSHWVVIWAIEGTVVLWTVAAILAAAFQCGLPRPWNYLEGNCFDASVFWNVIGAVDIITDVAMIVLPFWIVWQLQLSWQRKVMIDIAFAFRFLIIATAIARLVVLGQLFRSKDPLYDCIGFQILTQCQAHLSVIVASIPVLKPFLNLASTTMADVLLHPQGIAQTYNLSRTDKYGNSGNRKSGGLSNHNAIVTGNLRHPVDVHSVNSASSNQMFIRETKEWEVHRQHSSQESAEVSP